ncbi:MAG: hypothetical protein KDD11_19100 [Acidobacteria bacterium]|nr:hypothetical protein [Acidobacteriota bacterium]
MPITEQQLRHGGKAEALAASWQGWSAHARHARSPALIEAMRRRVGIDEADSKREEFLDSVRGQAP